MKRQGRGLRLLVAMLISCLISVIGPSVEFSFALAPQDLSAEPSADLSASLSQAETVGRELYLNEQFAEAVVQWQMIAEAYAAQQQLLGRAGALSNLSLSYQQLGQWKNAQRAIAESLRLIDTSGTTPGVTLETTDIAIWRILARSLMTQGSLQLALGQTAPALASWQQAADAYKHAQNEAGVSRAQVNQAQALRELGFYRQAVEKLSLVTQAMEAQPPSTLKAIALRRLGEAHRLSGQLSASQTALSESLAIAQQSGNSSEVSATLLSLGHTAQSLKAFSQAKDLYDEAIAVLSNTQRTRQRMPIELSQLDLAIATNDVATAARLWPAIQRQFEQLPISRTALYQQINWATSLIKFRQQQMPVTAAPGSSVDLPLDAPPIHGSPVHGSLMDDSLMNNSPVDLSSVPSLEQLAQQLRQTTEQSRTIGDRRAESYAIGTLGHMYEQNQQWAIAQQLTDRALSLSHGENDADLLYQWQWQLGRLWKAVDNPDRSTVKALEAYREAIETLSSLRGDLSATDDNTQFSFKENVEPIYRQLVSLLLQTAPDSPAYKENLESAQHVIESLRLAELDNYFQEACVDVRPVDISQADASAAVVYTVVLEDQLSVLLHLPNQPIQHFSTAVSALEVENAARQLRQQLVVRSRRDYLSAAAQIYDWLIAPAREAMDEGGVETLVFVLDGALQNVPMATLYDGEHFLIEDYDIALTPGLTLLNPQPWRRSHLRALIAGVTQSRQGFSSLPYVASEVEKISAEVPRHTVLLDQQFTQTALSQALKSTLHPIVHIATHGQFGSTAEETYLLAWDRLIDVREISQMLQANLGGREGIELLVLSACETASGDQRAALGLSGIAIKAGARSTIGSLWSVNDEASAEFAGYFYEYLTKPNMSRAAALRLAQLRLLNNPRYQHPIYWAPYTLLGSWL